MNKSEQIGLSPYAMVFRGRQKTENVIMRAMTFDNEAVNEAEIQQPEQLLQFVNSKSTLWLNVEGLHRVEIFQQLAKQFDIPENIFSDVLNPSVRPKVQEFEKGFLISIKSLYYDEETDSLSAENMSFIAMNNFLISISEAPGKTFAPVRDRIVKHKNKIRSAPIDYLAFALIDIIIDNYIYITGLLGDDIQDLEEKISYSKTDVLDEINHFKKEMNFLRKNIKPAKEMIFALTKPDLDLVKKENRIHYKELQDNINEASELADSYREMLYDISTTYHTAVSARLNDIMRTLTIISVIFIPLTFIVGIYGTNFDYMPEIHWRYGYFAMWAVMILAVILMLRLFKRKKWF
jgi:magnesium transporter